MGAFDDLIPGGPQATPVASTRARRSGNAFADLIPEGGAAAAPQEGTSFFEDPLGKIGRFAQKVYEEPPPSITSARDIIKAAPGAAAELTWGADPEAARAAAGTALQAGLFGLTGAPGTMGSVGVLGAPRAAPRAAPAIPPAAGAAAAPSIRDAVLGAAGRLDVEVPRFLATEGTTLPQLAGAIKNVPWAGEPIIQSAEKLAADLGEAKGNIAGSAATPASAGEQAAKGITGWIQGGSRAPEGQAYGAVDRLIKQPGGAALGAPDQVYGVPLTNTQGVVQSIIDRRVNARIPGTSKAADLVLDAIKGPMDYEGIKNLRSYVGELTPQQMIQAGINGQELRAIYGGLTRDLQTVISEAGGPQALQAWQQANALARLTNIQRAALARVVGPEGAAAPESIFAKLAAFAGSKSSADIARLRLAKNAMGPSAWDSVSAALINRLGMAPDGTFSPDRFVTAFGNMSPAGRSEMFRPDQLRALNDLFTVSKDIRDRITRLGNPSGTGRTIYGMLLGGAAFADPITTMVTLLGNRGAALAMTQPAVLNAANAAARASLRGNTAGMNAALTQMQRLAGSAAGPELALRLRQTGQGYPYYQQ